MERRNATSALANHVVGSAAGVSLQPHSLGLAVLVQIAVVECWQGRRRQPAGFCVVPTFQILLYVPVIALWPGRESLQTTNKTIEGVQTVITLANNSV
jgi:hypothetical protein